METKIKNYEIVDLGIEYFDYFLGFGTAFTNFEEEVVGIGDSSVEAYEDALDVMASRNIDISNMPEFCDAELEYYAIDSYEDELHGYPNVFVGIRYNLV